MEPSTGFDPIPAGKYPAVIVESNMKPTKNGNGQYLELTFEIIDGDFKGRKVWARLNLENQNSTAVQIARSELSAICRAVGVMQPQDSIELHNLPLIITVRCKKNPETDEITNEIKGYAGRTVANAPAAGGAPAAGAAGAPRGSGEPVKRLILPSVLLALALALAAAFEGIYPYAAIQPRIGTGPGRNPGPGCVTPPFGIAGRCPPSSPSASASPGFSIGSGGFSNLTKRKMYEP